MTDDLPIAAAVERVAAALEAKAGRIRAKAQAAERMAGELEPLNLRRLEARRRLEELEHALEKAGEQLEQHAANVANMSAGMAGASLEELEAGELGRARADKAEAERKLEQLERGTYAAGLQLEAGEKDCREALARFDEAAGRLERELAGLDGAHLEELAAMLERLGR